MEDMKEKSYRFRLYDQRRGGYITFIDQKLWIHIRMHIRELYKRLDMITQFSPHEQVLLLSIAKEEFSFY